MSSTSGSTIDQSNNRSRGQCGGSWGKKGNWSGFNIAGMVLGFVFFWPIGLFILWWIISGRNVNELPQKVREQWTSFKGSKSNASSDNVVFDEFQQTQYDRIYEIKEEIKNRSKRFRNYREDAKRRADEEEFNRFMSDAPGQ